MKMLMLSSRLPYPPDRADQKTVFHLMEHFAQRHTIHLAALIEHDSDRKYIPQLSHLAEKISLVRISPLKSKMMAALAPLSRLPLQVGYFNSRAMYPVVAKMVAEEKYDLVYSHLIRTSEFVRHLNCRNKVLALQIAQTLNYGRMSQYAKNFHKRLFFNLETSLCRRYESSVIHDFDLNLIISPFDQRAIDPSEQFDRFFFSPHGLDVEQFKPRSEPAMVAKRIMLTGNMFYNTNVDAAQYFVHDVLPIIRSRHADAEFHIVGRGPSAAVKMLDKHPGVHVVGTVPDLAEHLATAHVVVDPLRIGAGLQNKLLEGMAMGKPNVCTDVANEGIGGVHEQHLLEAPADDPEAFAHAVIRLLEDDQLAARLSEAARKFTTEGWTWEKHFTDLETRLLQLIEESDSPSTAAV